MISVWLPSPKRLARVGQWPAVAAVLARADRLPDAAPGFEALVAEAFASTPARLSEAALACLAEPSVTDGGIAGDAWLRADPVHLGADHSTLRLLAHGDLALDAREAEDLAAVLKPLFGDSGLLLTVAAPERWYLKLAPGAEVPVFSAPEHVLGDRLDAHMPTGAAGLRWQRLMTEVQMLLHDHRRNAERVRRGQLPVNSLWFWGGGRLPDRVTTSVTRIVSDDRVMAGLGKHLARPVVADLLAVLKAPGTDHDLFDLRAAFADPELRPILAAQLGEWARGPVPVRFSFASGERFLAKRWHRLRFWRKPPALA